MGSARWIIGGAAGAAIIALGAGAAAAADGERAEAGPYLAARAAARAADFPAGAVWFGRALAGDPADPRLLEGALAAELALGRLDAAAALADRLAAAGHPSALGAVARAARAARAGDWAAVLAGLEAPGGGAGPLVDGLLQGWALMGEGRTADALGAFDALAARPGLRVVGLYHKALALAQAGDLAAAEAILALPPEDGGLPSTRRGVLLRAEVLGAMGRAAEGAAVIDEAYGRDLDPAMAALRARIAAGEEGAGSRAATPARGLADGFYVVAGVLADEEGDAAALMYARAALALDPGHAEAALMAAARLEALGQPLLAQAAYALVPEADPSFPAAELGRAGSLRRAGEGEAAEAALARLARDHPDLAVVQAAHGDALRTLGRHGDAVAAYDRAVALYADAGAPSWFVHFTRALSRGAQDDWAGAEADLRRALEINPGEPRVLNHLGYGLVERGERLPEALELLEEAVAREPGNGAIVDSLGWALFRLGRHGEAVAELERAASLEPGDPVVNDHLGDAYWAVGRAREARFQWSRALLLDPEPAEVPRIRAKLAFGLGPGARSEAEAGSEAGSGAAGPAGG